MDVDAEVAPQIYGMTFHSIYLVGELHFAIFSFNGESLEPYRVIRMDSNFEKYSRNRRTGGLIRWQGCAYFLFSRNTDRFSSVKEILHAALKGELSVKNEGEVTWT